MKRPILIAVIGYIIGIIVGLYFNKSIVLIYIPIIALYFIYKFCNKAKKEKFKLLSIKRYFRYIKIYLNSKVILIVIISSLVSNTIVIFQNKNYERIYNNLSVEENLNLTGIIIGEKQEKRYYNKYIVEAKYNNKNLKLYIYTKKDIELNYGDKIAFSGTYTRPEKQRNYKGFDYSQYIKQLKVYGTIMCEKIQFIKNNQGNGIFKISNQILERIVSRTKKVLNEETASILLGLILGNKTDIDEQTQDDFRNASMSHILAISGMHVAYILLGINFIFKNLFGKKNTEIISIFILIFYMFITSFSPSIVRAGIMGIILIFSKLIYRKNDIYNTISISLFLILIYNPFLIQNLGLQLSYGGVIGIVIFNRHILNILKNINVKNKIYKYKIRPKIDRYLDKIKEIISVSISVQLFILPLITLYLNTFCPYFLISNLILSFVIGPVVIWGFIFIILILVNISIAKIFSPLIQIGITILKLISNIGKLPFSKIYVATPTIFLISIYYLFLFVLFLCYNIYSIKNPSKTQIRVKNLIALMKINLRKNGKKVRLIIIIIILSFSVIYCIPKNLKIYFIDVGQGDSSLIITPQRKNILIDGGGSSNSDFDVGKSTLIPYILDRGFTKIDIVIISHFDQDHVGAILTLLQELRVGRVYISKQAENSENYEKFLKIISEKNIKVYEVMAGNKIHIEKNLYLDILWPTENLISTNALNNNAMVFNLHYKKFSMLFTGDIEEASEKEILKLYSKNKDLLKANILKVAHHGSKTSSTSEFINVVNPKIAVIGVGKNNKFGHPNENVLERLKQLGCKVFRTDLGGEISIEVNRSSKYRTISIY